MCIRDRTKDTEGNITDARIKPGALYLNGSLLGFYPTGDGGSGSSWVKLPLTSGAVWLNVHFDQDAKLTLSLIHIYKQYVMDMASSFWGAGNTACLTTKFKAQRL